MAHMKHHNHQALKGHSHGDKHQAHHQHNEGSDDHGAHGHTHGVVDPSIATSDRGLWALKWSFVGLMIPAVLQVRVSYSAGTLTGCRSLLNICDADQQKTIASRAGFC